MSKAQGQFTIIDYNDALTLTGYIGSNHAKTQMYNPDNGSYNPDWSSTNLVLTPSLYVIGTTTDQITSSSVTSVKWYIGSSSTAITSSGSYALSGTKSHILTVKGNVMAGLTGIDYRCVITYKDASTGLSITHPLTISFSRVVNGGGIVDLLVTTPQGNVFKNTEVATLTAKAELWRGSSVDTTNVTYKWAIMDSTVTSTSSTGYDASFGVGWKKLSDTTGMYTGTTTATITIYAAAVDSYAVFKCIAVDHHVLVVTENRQCLSSQCACRNVHNAGQQLTCDFVHIGDHQQQTLRSSEGCAECASLERTVQSTSGTCLRLHLNNLNFLAEDVFAARSCPLVHVLSHSRRGCDRIDCSHLAEHISDVCSCIVTVTSDKLFLFHSNDFILLFVISISGSIGIYPTKVQIFIRFGNIFTYILKTRCGLLPLQPNL